MMVVRQREMIIISISYFENLNQVAHLLYILIWLMVSIFLGVFYRACLFDNY